MVSRRPRPSPASAPEPTSALAAGPARAKALTTLPLPLSRALRRFRAADEDFCASAAEHASVFCIDERYATLVARARELVSASRVLDPCAPPLPDLDAQSDDDEAQLGAARVVALALESR